LVIFYSITAHLVPEVADYAPGLEAGVDPADVPLEADGELGAPAGHLARGDDF